jgi:hypothetical protein
MQGTMIEEIRIIINRYFNIISIFFVLVTVLMLFFGQAFLKDYKEELSIKISLSFIAVYLGLIGDHLCSTKKRILRGIICPDQPIATKHFSGIIKNGYPKNADLIGYSAANLRSIIDNLSKQNCKIRLLVHNPDTAISPEQSVKIRTQIKEILKENHDIEIRGYNENGSLRGMNFENRLINIGWYSYASQDIQGKDNPLITVEVSDQGFDSIKQMFNITFNNLWRNGVILGKRTKILSTAI